MGRRWGHGEADRTADGAFGIESKGRGHVCRWRRTLPPSDRRRGADLDLPLHASWPHPGYGAWLPQRPNPLRSPYAGRGSASAQVGGIDPIGARNGQRATERAETAKQVTFKERPRPSSKRTSRLANAKHCDQWRNTLATYAYPFIGALPVQQIDAGLVVRVLEPIWTTKAETAGRVRQRIEAVLDSATARGHRSGENPPAGVAIWKTSCRRCPRSGGSSIIPRCPMPRLAHSWPSYASKRGWRPGNGVAHPDCHPDNGGHRGALVRNRPGAEIWTIPAERIKAGREHRIPLSPAAIALLRQLAETKVNEFVFPGRPGKPLSDGALLALLKRMKRSDLTTHGFRSTFRDWAAEQTNFPREVAEMALSHAIGDKVERPIAAATCSRSGAG